MSKVTVEVRLAEMTDNEKEAHVDSIECRLDYGDTDISADDYALYEAIIKEKSNKDITDKEAQNERFN